MPHTPSLLVLALCCAVSSAAQIHAQAPAAKKSPTTKASYTAKEPAEGHQSKSIAQSDGRDAVAISIINDLVDESNSYKDQVLRIRIQARAADALWDADDERARRLFRQAWEIAEKVDKDGEQNAEEARKRFMSSTNGEMILIPQVPNLRGEVLRLAAQHDSALGDELLARLEEAHDQEGKTSEPGTTTESFFDPTQPRLAIARRLELAKQLLEAGQVDLAKLYADPALNRVTSQGIIFLYALRQKEAEEADKRYARLLASAADDPTSDATTASLLSSYAVTPNFLVTATRRARISRQLSYVSQTYELSPELRASFFSVASKILLRPILPPDQDHTSAGRAGTYFTIARLLPLFEQHAPKYIPALNTQLALLAPDAPETFRNGEESMLRVGLAADKFNGGELPEVLNQLASAANSGDRDVIYVKAIQAAATKGDARVLEFAEKIEDANLRERARAFAALAAVRSAISKKDVNGGLHLVREGNLLPLHRIWAITQLTSLIKKTDLSLSIQLLNEAAAEANRIRLGTPERAYALVCVAAAFFDIDDAPRSWELAGDVVKAANAVDDFSGEEGKLTARLRARNLVAMIDSIEPAFNMATLFEILAKNDPDRADSTADGLTNDTTRSSAKFAIARSVLRRSKASNKSL